MPSPCGKRDDVELSRMRFVLSADALTKMMRALNSVHRVRVRVDHAHARRASGLLVVDDGMHDGVAAARVSLPVFAAHGSVDELELK